MCCSSVFLVEQPHNPSVNSLACWGTQEGRTQTDSTDCTDTVRREVQLTTEVSRKPSGQIWWGPNVTYRHSYQHFCWLLQEPAEEGGSNDRGTISTVASTLNIHWLKWPKWNSEFWKLHEHNVNVNSTNSWWLLCIVFVGIWCPYTWTSSCTKRPTTGLKRYPVTVSHRTCVRYQPVGDVCELSC